MDAPAILFDVGNTLVELDHVAIAATAREAGVDATVAQARVAEQRARGELDRWLGADPPRSTETTDTFSEYMRRTFVHLGATEGWQELVPRRSALWDVAHPRALEVLETLAARKVRLGAVSNSDGHVDQLLARHGLAEFFEVLIDSGAVGIEKPDPAIFGLAVEAMNLAPAETLYVGDLFHIDVKGAWNAGLQAVLLDPLDERDDVPVQRIRDITDLL